MESTDSGVLVSAWDRFEAWLARHAPADYAALTVPATMGQVAEVEAVYGFSLHPQVRALLLRHNGVVSNTDSGIPGTFLPLGYRLNSTSQIIKDHASLLAFYEDFPENWGERDIFGENPVAHSRQWVPIADSNDGGLAFVNHRPGGTYGYVYEFGMGSGASSAVEWASSLAGFFDKLTRALERAEPFEPYEPHFYQNSAGQRLLAW